MKEDVMMPLGRGGERGDGFLDGGLISKKELLEKYGISYGALYRWKRMGLIPEEWFIKKSTPTGQETFFDRQTICERMELIISSKDDALLQELAGRLSEKDTGRWTLVVTAAAGETSFEMERVRTVRLRKGGIEIDITDELRRKAK